MLGGIFINYGKLHDTFYLRKTINLEEKQTYFNEQHIGGDDFPH